MLIQTDTKYVITRPTTKKTFCGTLEYLAPEMMECSGHGKPLDWYTCGILLCEMLTGMTPFKN